jgi:uncharacterized membrane protein YeaQ/YmgE (transglycosylase-associated protein family)
MTFLSWIAFGLTVGLATSLLNTDSRKLSTTFSAVIMSILGAITGGFLSSIIFGVNLNQFNLIPLLSAGISSVLLLFVGNYLVDNS